MRSSNYFKNTGRANPVLYKHHTLGSNNIVLPAPGEGNRYVICDIIVNGDVTYSVEATTTATVDKARFMDGNMNLFWLEEGHHHFTPFALSENSALMTERDGEAANAWDVTVTYWIDANE